MHLLALTSVGAETLASELPPALADLFTIEIVDWPGTGNAEQVDGPSVAKMVDFATGLVDEETVLFGQSMQAALVLAVAAATPVRGVIAVAPPDRLPPDTAAIKAFWDAHAEPERRRRADALRTQFDTADDADKPMLYARYNSLRYFYDLDHPVPPPEDWTAGMAWAQEVTASGADVDWPATFDRVTSPVLVALGAQDFMCPPTLWGDAPRRDGWTIETFQRCGHSPFLEQPEEFVAATERWVTSL